MDEKKKTEQRERRRLWEKKQSENLTDRYVKKALRASGWPPEEITDELIEMNRVRLQSKRLLRKLKKEIEKKTGKKFRWP
jgi:hypothetical protein